MDLNEIVNDKQLHHGEEKLFDPDSSPEAIEYYKTIYKKHLRIYDEFDFSKIEIKQNKNSDDNKYYSRIHVQLKEDSKFINEELKPYFDISGDCDFNFNDKKLNEFKKIIDEDSPYFEKLVDFNKSKHHSLINMSLMLTTGAMNKFKGCSDPFDGLDNFLYNLNNYYNNVNKKVLSHSSNHNKTYLENYLNEYENVFDYCKQIYFIEDKFLIENLILIGNLRFNFKYSNKNERKDKEQEAILILYINLVERYWEEKEKNIKKHLESINK